MKLRLAVGLLALLAVAATLRAGTDVLVVSDAGVHMTVPGDPYYHLRRIVWSTEHFPRVLVFDRYLNHPHGGQVVWPPGFDWPIAAVARALAGSGDPSGAERVAARAPAVLGVLAVLGVWLLARRRFSSLAGWVAGGLLAVLPNHVLHSQVGQLDHHVAVSLAALALLALAMGLVAAPAASLRRAGGAGLAFGTALLLWPGMLIHLALLEAMLVGWVASAAARSEARVRARALAWLNAGALVAVAPWSIGSTWAEFGAWSPWVLSNFQPAFFLAAAASFGALAAGWGRWGETRAQRLGLVAGVGAAGLTVAFLLIPDLAETLATAAGWFSKEEAFQHNVRELQPFTAAVAVSRFSLLILVFPLACAWLALRSLREPVRPERWIVLGMAAAFFALAALQRRFGNTFSILYVLVWGWFAVEAAAALRARPALRWPAMALAGGAGLLALGSLAEFHGPRQQTLARAHADPALARRGPLAVEHRLYDVAGRWLEGASPTTRGWDDPTLEPEYGLMARWDAGHLLRYRARRPVVQDNFGVYGGRANYEAAERYYAAGDEAEAIGILEMLGVRYVLADSRGAGGQAIYGPGSMTGRLSRAFGTATPDAPALRHHRLVWHQRSGDGLSLAVEPPGSALGIWEIVAGARIEGLSAPGAEVDATLGMRTASGRLHVHRATARAGADGTWALVLPYPTDRPSGSAVRAQGPWEIRSGARTAVLDVSEEAVRAGARVDGPDLRPGLDRPALGRDG